MLKAKGLSLFLGSVISLSALAADNKPVTCKPVEVVHSLLKEYNMRHMLTIHTQLGIIVVYRDGDVVALVEYFKEHPTTACLVDTGRIATDDNTLWKKGS